MKFKKKYPPAYNHNFHPLTGKPFKDAADDGPEIPLIQFFRQYRDGATMPLCISKRFTPLEAVYLISQGAKL